jgi:hypothetical protein
MRWTTYNRLMDKLVAADDVADERLVSSRRGGRSFTRILIGRKAQCVNPGVPRRPTAARDVEPMGLSDWIGIFAIITFVGFAGMFYEVATRVFDD